MNVIIIGAGQVGTHIATILSEFEHNVAVIDKNPQQIEQMEETLDVRTLLGHGADMAVLESAGAAEADLVLAVSDSDELNFNSALLAKQLGARQTLVRARKAFYLEDRLRDYISTFKVDRVVCPEVLTAQEIAKRIEHPGTQRIEYFGHGRVQLRTMLVTEQSRQLGVPLKDIKLPGRTLIVGILRPDPSTRGAQNGANGRSGHRARLIVPHGGDRIEPGDKLTVLGSTSDMLALERMFTDYKRSARVRRAVVMGGGLIGFYLTSTLARHNIAVTLVEHDRGVCRRLAADLPRAEVLFGDATSLPFLEQARLGNTDVFAATTSQDDSNLMACLLMSELGVKQTAAVMHRPDFATLVDRLGVAYALSPRHMMGDTVNSMLQHGNVLAVAMLEGGLGEAIEYRVNSETPIVGKRLKEAKLPTGALVGAIVRQGEVLIPKGDDHLQCDDTVVVCVQRESMARVEALFRGTP